MANKAEINTADPKWNLKVKIMLMENGKTATDIANKMGVTVQYISSALTGHRKPSEALKQRIIDTAKTIAGE